MFDLQFRSLHAPTQVSADVYWITHAGGGTNTLMHRMRTLDADTPIRVQTPRMPAREELIDVPFAGDLNRLAELIAVQIEADRQQPANQGIPFAIVGHSFGSILAYRVTCELAKRGQMPIRLVVLSFPSPEDLSHDGELNKLSDEQLVEEVDKLFGGVPEGIRQDETALKFFVPGLRFDLGLLEGYRHQSTKPLQVPIVAICGTDDRAVNVAEMHGWQQMTTAPFRLRSMPGDHFFPLQRMPEILQVAVWDVLPR